MATSRIFIYWNEKYVSQTLFLISTEDASAYHIYDTFTKNGVNVEISMFKNLTDEYEVKVEPKDLKDGLDYNFDIYLYKFNFTFKKFNELMKEWEAELYND